MDTRPVRTKRSVRHARANAARPTRAPNQRHLTKLERERRTRRLVLAAGILIVLLVIAIPGYGYYHEVIRLGDAPIAVVDGQSLTLEQYARYDGAWQGIVARQIARVRPLAPPASATPATNLTPAQQSAQTTLQSLEAQQSNLSSSGISGFLEARLLLDEGTARGLTVTQAEMDNARRWLVSPPDTVNPNGGVQPVPDTLPVTGTVALVDASQDFTQIANPKFLTAAQIDEEIVKPAVLKAKLVAALAGPVQTTEPQIHARHILVATEAEALTVRKQLDAGGDFAALAKQYSTDTSNKDKGGDLGWFGKGVMVPEFETAAFAMKAGEISQPVKSSFGYHIIQVLEIDPNHPLDATRLTQLREQGYQTWLGKAQSDPTKVSVQPASSRTDWVRTYIATPT